MDGIDHHSAGHTQRPGFTRIFGAGLLVAVPLALSACGTAVGAAGGGLAGNQFGHGSGKTAATVGGVAAGGLIGHAVTGD